MVCPDNRPDSAAFACVTVSHQGNPIAGDKGNRARFLACVKTCSSISPVQAFIGREPSCEAQCALLIVALHWSGLIRLMC